MTRGRVRHSERLSQKGDFSSPDIGRLSQRCRTFNAAPALLACDAHLKNAQAATADNKDFAGRQLRHGVGRRIRRIFDQAPLHPSR